MNTGPQPSIRWGLAIVLLAIGLRVAACLMFPANMSDDRDVYLAIAQGVHEGRGYSSPGTTVPTAFRPPLYPLILAPISGADQQCARMILHAGLGGVMTAALIWLAMLARYSPGRQMLAGLLVAADPLLVYYASLPMTETLAAAVSALLLALATAAGRSETPGRRTLYSALAAVAFGLCVLTRPTYWAFAVCVVAFGFWQWVRSSSLAEVHAPRTRDWVIGAVLCGLCVMPWPLRNWSVMGQPVLTTTHGGYTLLLGNNPAYYREVVHQPLGTVWDGSRGPGQEAWVNGLLEELKQAGVSGELQTDRWMKNRAWEAIRQSPTDFVKACGRRFLSFWGVRPHAESASVSGRLFSLGAAVWYSVLWVALLAGLWATFRRRTIAGELSVLLVAAFVMAHLVYWTDARMRAPVVPAIALLAAAAGWRGQGRSSTN